jgi:hypothetical protein
MVKKSMGKLVSMLNQWSQAKVRSSSNLKCPEASKLEKIASLIIKPFVFPPRKNTKLSIFHILELFPCRICWSTSKKGSTLGSENGALHSVVFKYA